MNDHSQQFWNEVAEEVAGKFESMLSIDTLLCKAVVEAYLEKTGAVTVHTATPGEIQENWKPT